MLALCSLALGAWFRFGSQPAPAAEPALAEQAASNLLLYLPIVVEAVQPVWLGPDGGLFAAVAASPQDANRVYAGSWGGGVYRSDDGGLTWRWASQGLGNLTVVSMAADPSNPDIAYAGTYRGGVYKTIDGGSTWSEANQGIQGNAIVYSMVVNPQVPQRVYAATRGLSNNGGQPWAGVTYRSDDGGASWYSVLSNLGGSNYQDWTYMLAISRTSPSTLMAATHEHGIYKTTNAGSGWGAANNGITRFTTRGIGIGPTSASAGTAYTGVWTGEGAFKTTNLGGSWTQKSSGISGANIYGLDIDYANPQKVYLATYNKGVMSTSSGGNSWSNAALSNRPVSTVRVHPGNSALVFAGTAGLGLFASRDSGGSWSPSMDGLQASSATGVVVSPINPSELYAGVDGGGVQVSSDGGLSWSDFSNNIGSAWVNGLVQQPGSSVLFAFTEGAGLYRCDLQNLALCWDQVGGNLPTDSQQDAMQSQSEAGQPGQDAPPGDPASPRLRVPRPFSPFTTFQEAYPPDSLSIEAVPGNYGLLALAFAPSNPSIAYIGSSSGGAFASSDGGFNWQSAGLSSQTVWALAVDPLDPQTVYAATSQSGVVKVSSNGGGSWNNSSIPNRDVYALAVPPANPGAPLAGTDDGVYQLTGGSWQPLGLSGQTVAWISIAEADSQHILAGTTDGAYTTIDGGITWQPVSAELAGHTVQNISLDPFNPSIAYYSTTVHGVLKAGSGK